MQTSFFLQSGLWWVLALVLGFPLAMLVMGELILRLERRKRPIAAPMRILRNWIFPSLALFVLLVQVIRLPRTDVRVNISETLLWITVIYSALTLLNVILFEDAPEGSWQAKVPQLLRDLGRFILVLVGSAIVLSTVWGADLGGLLTALGVGSLVIGLALQDSLGNIFSGVSLLFEQPFSIGDWIQVGDSLGKVIEINWRSVHLFTSDNDLLVVPNSELAKGTFTNFSRPTRIHVRKVEISFSYDDPPNKVRQVLQQVALEIEGVLSNPQPQVEITSYGDFSINYQVELFAPNYEVSAAILNEFNNRIWYAVKRHHLTMPYPIQSEVPYEPAKPTLEEQQVFNLQALQTTSGFAGLKPTVLQAILNHSLVQDYARHETVLKEGETLPGLYLILEGKVNLMLTDSSGHLRTIGVLSAGEVFGEKASLLSDKTIDITVRAAEDLRVLLIDTDTLQLTLEHSPRLAQELGEVMELRRRAVMSVKDAA
jgi:small-conductance mechanosensitive channel